MKHKHLLALACSLSWLVSCQNESESLPLQSAELSMSVIARIGEPSVIQGRYAGSEPNSAEFTTGDQIGLFVDDEPAVCWTYENLSWTPSSKVHWPDKVSSHQFRAFYPYSPATSSTQVPMPSLLGQTGSMTSVSQCDFLAASTSQSYGDDGIVSFQGEGKSFLHISSLVQIQINADEDLSNATLNRLTLSGANIVAPSVYSFTDGVQLTPDSKSDQLVVDLNYDMTSGSHTLYLVVNEKLNTTTDVSLTLEYTVGNQSYQATKSSFSGNVFQGGMKHSFTLTVLNRTLHISGGTITPWQPGNELEDIIIDATQQAS